MKKKHLLVFSLGILAVICFLGAISGGFSSPDTATDTSYRGLPWIAGTILFGVPALCISLLNRRKTAK